MPGSRGGSTVSARAERELTLTHSASDFDLTQLGRIFRQESGRCVATLIGYFGDIDVAEEAVQDAFVAAGERWPITGVPPNPGAWITTTARNRAIDRLRREGSRNDRYAQATLLHNSEPIEVVGSVIDDRLRLMFTCCHPSLATEVQVALTLRLLCGLQTNEIARAFLVPEATMAQRIVRAKSKIRANNIPYRVPVDHELVGRLAPVLNVVYLVFNEGYSATSGHDLVRGELCEEAIRLARLLAQLMPDEPEVLGLLALLLLTESRRVARIAEDGSIVLLSDQDRGLWNMSLIEEGQGLVRTCLRRNAPGSFQIQAAINAVHSDARTAANTDWPQVVALYDQLLVYSPTPVVALNRAVAVAEVDGPEIALALIEGLELQNYHIFHATRAEFLFRLGRFGDAADAFDTAIALTDNDTERKFLELRSVTARTSSR